ncbi:MAG: hypothetical protein QXO75_11920, partial [Nitrososphaerota archaeon]
MTEEPQFLSIILNGETVKINLTTGSFDIPVETAKLYCDEGVISQLLKDRLSNYSTKVQRSILKGIESLFKKTLKKPPSVKIAYKTRFIFNDSYYVEIEDNDKRLKFLKHGNGEFEIVEFVKIPDPDNPEQEIIIKPAPQIAQQVLDRVVEAETVNFVKFPPPPLPYGSPYELYIKMKNFIHKFVEVKPENEILLPLWIAKAVLADVLKDMSFPLGHIRASFGHGKTRLLTVLTEMTPWGLYLSNVSSAPLKRVSELYSPILYVDEKGEMDNEMAAMLNSKFNRNSVILNADQEHQRGYSALVAYRIFGPMMMAGRTALRDDAIESKAFQIDQDFPLTRKDIPRKIKGKLLDDFEKEAKEIRGMLLQFRIDFAEKINYIENNNFLSKYQEYLEPRLYEILSFFDDLLQIIPELQSDLKKVLRYQIIRNIEVAQQTPNGVVATTILNILENSNPEEDEVEYSTAGKNHRGIPLKNIYEEVGANYARQVGRIIQALGLTADRPRIEWTDRDGKVHKQRVTVVRIPNEKKLLELKSRYDKKYVEEVLLPQIEADGEQNDQSTLDNEDEEDEEKGYSAQNNEQNNENKKEGSSQVNRPN